MITNSLFSHKDEIILCIVARFVLIVNSYFHVNASKREGVPKKKEKKKKGKMIRD